MTFIPYYDKIEVRPIRAETYIETADKNFEEMGEVIAVGEYVEFVKPGDILIFVSHGCWETPEIDGAKHYVVTNSPEYVLGKVEHVAGE